MIENKISGLIGLAMRAGKVVFGTDACKQEIQKNRVKLLIIAKDAAERTKTNFKYICIEKNIPIVEILEKETISKSIGKDNKVIIGIKDMNFSKEIIKLVNGGEAIE